MSLPWPNLTTAEWRRRLRAASNPKRTPDPARRDPKKSPPNPLRQKPRAAKSSPGR
jgi:hypothetical protein